MNFLLIMLTFAIFNGKPQHELITARADVDGVTYQAILNKDYALEIKTSNGKTVSTLKSEQRWNEGVSSLQFLDFDRDGNKDLLIRYNSNVPDRCDLLLYNKILRKFVLIKGFPDYPRPRRLPDTHFYYSYHRNGCADLDWISDLFTICNGKVVTLASISAAACDQEPKGIFLYKVNGKKRQFIKRLLVGELRQSGDAKTDFIAHYWKDHYRRFIAN